jgi:hypothetical protein
MTTTRQGKDPLILEQVEKMAEHNVTGMTKRQRYRYNTNDVVSPEERQRAFVMAARLPQELGPAPHGDTGRMRVVNMHTGEIQIKRAPARKLDLETEDAVDLAAQL